MCGIAGVISGSGNSPEASLLTQMSDTMWRRGPDDSGVLVHGRVGFAFRRLAIIDLTDAGRQPMETDCKRYSIVFNGEIYNYKELREKLRNQGHSFKGESDTEVLLRLYMVHGQKMLALLNGMFSFAIHDRSADKILLARDRFGKKPLFYWRYEHGLAFASEVKALRILPGFPSEFDQRALSFYWRLGIIPSWTCIYPGVSKLPAACSMEYSIEKGQLSDPSSYWNLPPAYEDESLSKSSVIDEMEHLIGDATRIRLRSDVPVGVFLSGGIDSGLIASFAATENSNIQSYTIGFPGWSGDESQLAAATARRLGLNLTIRNLDEPELISALPALMAHFDEPFADSSALPTHLVCAEAGKFNKVVLSGDGGDEVFAGYKSHWRASRFQKIELVPLFIRQLISRSARPLLPPDARINRFAKRFGRPIGSTGLGATLSPVGDWMDRYIDPAFLQPEELISAEIDIRFSRTAASSAIDHSQRTDLGFYMPDDILVKVDRMSMYNSIEVRSPLLDYRIVELALRIPSRLRIRDSESKSILRCLAGKRLPDAVLGAPKRGFGIPLSKWIRDPRNAGTFRDSLLSRRKHSFDCFVAGGAERLWKDATQNPSLVPSLFQALSFQWWSEALGERSDVGSMR